MPRSKFAKYSCEICKKTLRRKQNFESHMKTHLPPEEKPFKCGICDKSFGSQAWLTRHGKIHLGEGQQLQLAHDVTDQEAAHCSGTCQQNWKHLDLGGYEAGVTDPFIIFPREIWCMILDNVDYFNDLQTIFVVYPGLEALQRRKRQLYLFDQVILHVAKWVKFWDLINCRRVCKQWKTGVHNFLENHPSVRAYNHEADHKVAGQIWSPSRYITCDTSSYLVEAQPEQGYVNYLNKIYTFIVGDNLHNFMLIVEGHPAEINPFVGRYISLDFGKGTCGKSALKISWRLSSPY